MIGRAVLWLAQALARLAFRLNYPGVWISRCPLCRAEAYASQAAISNARHRCA